MKHASVLTVSEPMKSSEEARSGEYKLNANGTELDSRKQSCLGQKTLRH